MAESMLYWSCRPAPRTSQLRKQCQCMKRTSIIREGAGEDVLKPHFPLNHYLKAFIASHADLCLLFPNQGLKAYFKEAFSTTLQMSAVSWDNKFDQSLSAVLLKEQPTSGKERDLLSKLIERKREPCLSRQSSEEVTKFILYITWS